MKHLYDSLRPCQKEEEVKAEFCKFFKMKVFALRGIDHYTENVLFEFKYDRNFRNTENVARVLAQTMYYARLLKFGAGLTKYPLPPYICVVDKNEAFFAETKDRDAFYAPTNPVNPVNPVQENSASSAPPRLRVENSIDPSTGLPDEFVTDCVVWAAFSSKNNCVSLRNVQYKGKVWQIANQMYPFLLDEVRQWPCAHGDIAAQLAAANEDRFLAKWLNSFSTGLTRLTGLSGAKPQTLNPDNPVNPVKNKLSPEARAVLDAARALYREFYANLTSTPWMDWKIETWDVGYYQIRNAMKDVATAGAPSLRIAHDALRAKLLPQIYTLGFLNPDVVYFT